MDTHHVTPNCIRTPVPKCRFLSLRFVRRMSPSEIFFKIYFYSHLDAYFFVQNFTENPNCYKNKCALSYNTIIIIIIIIHDHSTKFLLPGVPLYGRAFSLMNPNSNRMGAPAKDTSFQVPQLSLHFCAGLRNSEPPPIWRLRLHGGLPILAAANLKIFTHKI